MMIKNIHKINNKDKLASWMNSIAIVPQDVFIKNDTIKSNIAFGYSKDQIDNNKIERCLKLTQLIEFVNSQNNGIDTFLGGPHVIHVVNQVVKKLTAMAKSKAGKTAIIIGKI